MHGKKMLVALAMGTCLSGVAYADITNPRFETGLSGWTVAGGSVEAYTDAADTFALLQDAGGPTGPASSSFYQDFVLGPGSSSLSFEYRLLTDGTYVGAGVLPDAFTVRLIDPVSLAPLLSTPGVNDYYYHDTRGAADSIDFDGTLVASTLDAARADWSRLTLDLTSLAEGTATRLQFDLLGTGLADGQLTLVGVDNLVLQTDDVPIIPAPSAAVLALIGLAIVRWVKPKCS